MADLLWSVRLGDVREQLRRIPSGTVQCVVTSPPYFGLRDYGHAGQIGLEETPDAYVASMVAVFREVKRVLRDDGVLWLNLGDSYAGGGGFAPDAPSNQARLGIRDDGGFILGAVDRREAKIKPAHLRKAPEGLKPKDLVGIPWMVAFALRADGWYLRSDVIWAKPNPMPESCTDRPTRAHEYVFLLSKSEQYYFDAEAIRETNTPDMKARAVRGHTRGPNGKLDASRQDAASLRGRDAMAIMADGRNARSVWTFTTQSYADAHFAVFPPELPTRCIQAGSSETGACRTCGAPLARVVVKGAPDREQQRASGGDANGAYTGQAVKPYAGTGAQNPSDVKRRILKGMTARTTTHWVPTCQCDAAQAGDIVPCVVLDPFTGSGTTGAVAIKLQRSFIGIDLNPAYVALARRRIGVVAPLFATELDLPGTVEVSLEHDDGEGEGGGDGDGGVEHV
jgi:DNA modification methylase